MKFIKYLKMKTKKYPVIEIPASGKSSWAGGAWCFCFMYTKHHGNFILKGFYKEIKEYIKAKKYTHYFYNMAFMNNGKCRHNNWNFWKNDVGIFSPRKYFNKWDSKYTIRCFYTEYEDESPRTDLVLELKRMPHRWIPEFDKF